jgi:hypothetical protein
MLSAATKRTCYSIGSDEYTVFFTKVQSMDLDCFVAPSSPFCHSSTIISEKGEGRSLFVRLQLKSAIEQQYPNIHPLYLSSQTHPLPPFLLHL